MFKTNQQMISAANARFAELVEVAKTALKNGASDDEAKIAVLAFRDVGASMAAGIVRAAKEAK